MTICQDAILSSRVKFLGLTVLSVNGSLGWGTQESTLSVDLIQDCENGDIFVGKNLIGYPAYFPDPPVPGGMTFGFNGIITSWTSQKSSGGKTYSVKMSDPRQLLENTAIIVDTYSGPPVLATNYFNVYAHYESGVFNGNCATFGNANSNERGMTYFNILQALIQIGPVICSPTGAVFSVDFSQLVGLAPQDARVTGPSITMMELIQQLCDMNGCDFYVTLSLNNTIVINIVQLIASTNTNFLLETRDGLIVGDRGTTEISYGRELRNEKVKTVIFGEKQHYLTKVTDFEYYFGEDKDGKPILPIAQNDCGFTIRVDITALNASLLNPLPVNEATLTELDIRCALASYRIWNDRAFMPDAAAPGIAPNGSLNKIIQDAYPNLILNARSILDNVENFHEENRWRSLPDRWNAIRQQQVQQQSEQIAQDLQKIHGFVSNLGSTYYGKQFFVKLPNNICVINDPEIFKEKLYSDIPTNDGGWVDPGIRVLGLADPELGVFRQDDERIGAFALFTKDGEDEDSDSDSENGIGPVNPNPVWNGIDYTPPDLYSDNEYYA